MVIGNPQLLTRLDTTGRIGDRMTWIAIDTKTNRIVGFGSQSEAKLSANTHKQLSGNDTITRKLRVGMIIYEG